MDDEADVTGERTPPRKWNPGERMLRNAARAVAYDALDLRRLESAIAELIPELPLEWRSRLAKVASERGRRAVDALLGGDRLAVFSDPDATHLPGRVAN